MTVTEKINMETINAAVEKVYEDEVKKKNLCEQMLIGIVQEHGGPRILNEVEIGMLRSAGVIHGETYKQESQVRAAFGQASQILKDRNDAGLGGEYEKRKEELPKRKAERDSRVEKRNAEIARLQAENREDENATAADEAKLARMETVRARLRERAPQHIVDKMQASKQSIRHSIGAEYNAWKVKLDHAEMIASLPADPTSERVIDFCTPRGMEKPSDPPTLLDQSRAEGLMTITDYIREGESLGIRQRSVNRELWAQLQSKAKQALPELRETTGALKADRDEQMREAEKPRDHYLQVNPWSNS